VDEEPVMRKPRYAYRLGWRSIRRVCPHLTTAQARTIADALGPAFRASGITTRRRAAMAVAQMAHESAGFRTTTEYASGAAYEGREDLGNIRPGDGRRFKGRGYIQITGRANYRAVSKALGHDFLARPADLAKPRWAAKASCWWWKNAGCNQIADRGDFVALTRRINGGVNGLADRRRYYRRARLVSPFLVPKRRRPF
jgi:predicted chitinase